MGDQFYIVLHIKLIAHFVAIVDSILQSRLDESN